MSDSLLPPNATAGEIALEGATARIGDVPTPARGMWNPDTCPANLLPWLAWAFSVDNWDTGWTEAQKRAAITASYEIHRRKGTIGAVRRALNALGLGMQVVEGFDDTPVGDPYTFRVKLDVDQGGASQEALAKAIAVVESAKNLRSHLAGIDLTIVTRATPTFAGVTMSGNEITIQPWIGGGASILAEDGRALATEDGVIFASE